MDDGGVLARHCRKSKSVVSAATGDEEELGTFMAGGGCCLGVLASVES